MEQLLPALKQASCHMLVVVIIIFWFLFTVAVVLGVLVVATLSAVRENFVELLFSLRLSVVKHFIQCF
jgi:hypothetical protein